MYIRLSKELNDVGILVPAEQEINKYITNFNNDYYSSLYYYNEEQKKYAEETIVKTNAKGETYNRARGVSGIFNVTTDKIFFDFDSNDLDLAKKDTITVVDRLKSYGVPEESIDTAFSGSKGFSIIVNHDQSLSPSEVKTICTQIAQGISTFDPKIYNASRIFRVVGTKHPKTGLYKTQLTIEELRSMSVDDIKSIAAKPYLHNPVKKTELPETIIKMKYSKVTKTEEKAATTQEFDLDLNEKPRWLSNWKFALSRGYFGTGMRNSALLILAATCKANSFSQTQTYYFLKAAADEQSKRFNCEKFDKEEIWKTIIEQVYGDHWKGGTFSEDNFPDDLKDFLVELNVPREKQGHSPEEDLVESVTEGFGDFAKYAKDINKYTIKSGIASLDKELVLRKGHMIGLIAPPGVGKSSFAFTFANNMSKEGNHVYFGSYDMYRFNVYQKLIQRHTKYTENQIYNAFVDQDLETIDRFKEVLEKEYSNVSFCFKTGQTVGQLKTSIKEVEAKRGKIVDLVIVDYLELVLTEFSDPTTSSSSAIQGLREIANEGRVVLVLLQPNKMSSKPNEPLTSYNAAKGSSSISQAVTAMLTLHRPGLHSRLRGEDNFIGLDCVKNRNGGLFSLDFYWDGKTQTIRDIDDAGRVRIDEVRQMVRDLDREEDDDF